MEVKTLTNKNIAFLVEHGKQDRLCFNDEYQRAAIWKLDQKQMFVDSILRGYSIPAFYFHLKGYDKPVKGEALFPKYDVIDGQQRIRAVQEFYNDEFKLLDPNKDSFRFPNFAKGKKCHWAEKTFSQLEPQYKRQLKNQKIIIFELRTEKDNEIRDLFIRLQGGTPLTPQDKRDAWPGNFTKYIITIAGKSALNKNEGRGKPGWPFFREVVSGKESNKRQLAAQIAMLYFHRLESGQKDFCSIGSARIDSFYHQQIAFDDASEAADSLRKILETLTGILEKGQRRFKGTTPFI